MPRRSRGKTAARGGLKALVGEVIQGDFEADSWPAVAADVSLLAV